MTLTPPAEFAAWTACAAFAVMLFNQFGRALYTLRGKPTPAEIATAGAALSERITMHAARIDEHDRRLTAIEHEQHALRALILTENDKVFRRVNAVADECGKMRGELSGIQGTLSLLLQKSIAPGKDPHA